MELWVRSQRNDYIIQGLYNIKQISIEYAGENDNYYLIINDGTEVAIYNSKERALEVLDEIQEILNPMLIFKNCELTKDDLDSIREAGACFVNDNAKIEQVNTCVSQMPEE